MGDPDDSAVTPPPERNGCMIAFMVVVGIVLLLPGLCALIFGVASIRAPHEDSAITSFVIVGLLVGIVGIMLIWEAIHGPRR